ncbi:MAG: hypothetical protein K2X87_21370 [Gemmataceae bacterium]|nr:hypothetical protein [Gemmataceae bacterium]
MGVEWTDDDPATGARRFVCAEKFARRWHFKVRFKRRTEWDRSVAVTRDMWEALLVRLERRYPRREGVTDEDLAAVRKVIAGLKPEPGFDGEGGVNHKDTKDTKEDEPEG